MSSYIELAYKISSRSTHLQHRMAAVVYRGGSVLSTAHNLGKWHACCERRALRPHQDMRGATIIVVRSNGGMSKPCKFCQRAIEAAGIKKIVYFNYNGEIVIERVATLN